MSRETRLLIVTITVSALVLLLLTRMRFPEQPPIVAAPAAPLERLAARATYDELAGIVARVERQIAPNLVVLRLSRERRSAPRTLGELLAAGSADGPIHHVAALRIDRITAVGAVAANDRIVDMVGRPADAPPIELVAADPVRQIALVRVPPSDSDPAVHVTLNDLRTPTYVIVVEGTRGGLTFRPVFVGSSDRFSDPRWSRPLLAVSSVALTSPGALVFSLEGQFLGFGVVEGGMLAIAGARDVVAAAEALAAGPVQHPRDPGVAVQPLTDALAAALNVNAGIVVADVDPQGVAAGVLQPADVITMIGDQPVEAPDDFLLRVAGAQQSQPLALTVVRGGRSQTVTLNAPGVPAPQANEPRKAAPSAATRTMAAGLSVRPQGRTGSLVVQVVPDSDAARAGLSPGDLIVQITGRASPTPAQIEAVLRDPASPPSLVVVAEREGRRRVTALTRPTPE
jgi:serine protease Do